MAMISINYNLGTVAAFPLRSGQLCSDCQMLFGDGGPPIDVDGFADDVADSVAKALARPRRMLSRCPVCGSEAVYPVSQWLRPTGA